MPALTESEDRARAALLTIDSYDVSIDLTTTPVLSRTAISSAALDRLRRPSRT